MNFDETQNRELKCNHPFESVVCVIYTGWPTDAYIVHCNLCDTDLYGAFSRDSEQWEVPSGVYDHDWFEGPDGFDITSKKFDQIPGIKKPWSNEIEEKMPDPVRYSPVFEAFIDSIKRWWKNRKNRSTN